jgi:hypothetical protein
MRRVDEVGGAAEDVVAEEQRGVVGIVVRNRSSIRAKHGVGLVRRADDAVERLNVRDLSGCARRVQLPVAEGLVRAARWTPLEITDHRKLAVRSAVEIGAALRFRRATAL